MKLTPLDIRKQDFEHSLRGYEPEEVQAFLRMLSEQWQTQIDEQRRLEEKVSDLEGKIRHYERVEEALQEAMQTARENKKQTLENAQREADLMVQEAEAEAEKIRQNAQEEHDRLQKEASKVGGRRQEIVARLRAFLMSEMELLAHFEGDDPVGFIKMLPPERRRRLREAGVASGDAADEDWADDASEESEPGAAEAAAPPVPGMDVGQENGKDPSPDPAPEEAPEAEPEAKGAFGASAASDDWKAPAASEEHSTAEEEEELPDYLDRLSEEDEEEEAAEAAATPRQVETLEDASKDVSDEKASPGWIVNSLFSDGKPAGERSSGGEASARGDDQAASSEEMQKIRRILKGME